MSTGLTESERLAAQWHDQRAGDDGHGCYSSCWCCCTTCDPDWGGDNPNPHFNAAKAAVRTEPVIVGIESHRFQGDGPTCAGVLGFARGEDRHGEVCEATLDAPIHTKGV
jgi:hypothetical protein